MANQIETAQLEWRDGKLPIATKFDDPYFSVTDGLAETRHVFLNGNGLPRRFKDGFHIAELGFGTGLNLLAAWDAWLETGQEGQLQFTSFEAFPMQIADMKKALSAWPELNVLASELLTKLKDGSTEFETDTLRLRIINGDARHTLPTWGSRADAWFLDGFSPAKNPELWEKNLLKSVGKHTNSGGTFATYTAAGFVRMNLDEAGFEVERIDGFGRKRHMTVGTKR